MSLDGLDIFVIALVVLVLWLLFAGIKTVPQGYQYTVERFGRYTRTLEPGLNIIIPFFDKIGARMNVMEQVLEVPTQEVITRDNASVASDAIAFYQVLNAAEAAYQVAHLENAILNLTMTNIRSVMGSMDLDELLSNRDKINDRLLHVVDEAAKPWGVKITRVEIKDIAPPKDLVDSMARQMKAERDKRAQVLEAEGSRNAQILRAEGAKQSAILQAEGQREAAFRNAEARERLAEAEAKATKMVSEAIAAGNVQAINYFVAQKYTEALASVGTAPNSKIVLMPMEASSLIGSLGGIGAIAREVFGDGPASAQTRPRASTPAVGGPAHNPFDPRGRLSHDRPHRRRTGPLGVVGARHRAADPRGADAGGVPRLDRRRGDHHRRAVPASLGGGWWIWQVQWLLFAVLSIAAVLVGRRLVLSNARKTDEPFLNQRAQSLVGRTATLDQPIAEGRGRIRLDDTMWSVQGPDLPTGTRVRVVASSGRDLTVEPV